MDSISRTPRRLTGRRSAQTLRDRINPAPGGVQIQNERDGICTLGFNVKLFASSGLYFVTNSHCTRTQGTVDGIQFTQPAWSTFPYAIAREVKDPPYFTNGCPSGYTCRFSDSALIQYYNSSSGQFGYLAHTYGASSNGRDGSITIYPQKPRFKVIGEDSGIPTVGEYIQKMGRTTGWTYGQLDQACFTGYTGGRAYLCQHRVENTTAKGGDSGSPVFTYDWRTDEATIYGILWGGRTDTDYVYSDWWSVRYELGQITATAP